MVFVLSGCTDLCKSFVEVFTSKPQLSGGELLFQQLCLGLSSREYYGSENILACQPSTQQ